MVSFHPLSGSCPETARDAGQTKSGPRTLKQSLGFPPTKPEVIPRVPNARRPGRSKPSGAANAVSGPRDAKPTHFFSTTFASLSTLHFCLLLGVAFLDLHLQPHRHRAVKLVRNLAC